MDNTATTRSKCCYLVYFTNASGHIDWYAQADIATTLEAPEIFKALLFFLIALDLIVTGVFRIHHLSFSL